MVSREVLWCQTYHSPKGDGSGGVVVNSDEVDEEGGPTHHGWDHEGPDEHLLYPSSACIRERREMWAETCRVIILFSENIKPIVKLPPCFAYKLPPK